MGGGWWISDLLNDPNINGQVWVVSWGFWIVISICLHELAHGWVAIKLGDDTPRLAGHMTWNPLVHMGPYSLIVFLFIGLAWGAMPVNPNRLRGRYADALVSIAGPLMNLLLGILSLIGLIIWIPLASGNLIGSVQISEPLAGNMKVFLNLGAMLNFVLMMFNLIPAFPLDGGRIMMSICPPYRKVMDSPNGRWFGLALFFVCFVFSSSLFRLIANVLTLIV